MYTKSWVSFDCWGTILKANPDYREKRNKLLHSIVFPEMDICDTEFSIRVKKLKMFSDYSNESLGQQMSAHQSLLLMCLLSGVEIPKEIVLSRMKLYDDLHKTLLVNNLPQVYCDNTRRVLSLLKNAGIGMNISCNTSIMNGECLDIVFRALELDKYFDFTLYSDVIRCSKPSETFFKALLSRIGIDKAKILHVGDNSFSDGGSVNIGIDFLHINGDSSNTIFDTLTAIE